MKNLMKRSALVALVLLSALCSQAQQPGLTPPPPPAPAGPGAPGPGPMRPAGLAQLTTINGKVVDYVANDRYEYDGFSLQTSDKTVIVKFPARLAAQLMKTAEKGSSVTVSGAMDDGPDGSTFRLYSLKAGSNTVTDTPPAGEQTPPAETFKNFSGTISDLNHDQKGMINGVILNGKTLVSLPPPAIEQLASYLKTGTELSGSGVQRALPEGVVLAKQLDLTDARTLSIGGQTYLIR